MCSPPISIRRTLLIIHYLLGMGTHELDTLVWLFSSLLILTLNCWRIYSCKWTHITLLEQARETLGAYILHHILLHHDEMFIDILPSVNCNNSSQCVHGLRRSP
jgi:hypothetical protein